MTAYLITSSIISLLLFVMWNTKSWLNMIIKITLFSTGLWGGVLALKALALI